MILYIDTSGPFLHLALFKDKLIDKIELSTAKDLSTITISEVDKILKNNNITIKDISIILLVNGPGSYTGTRIATTFAKICSWSLNIKVIEISSLDVLILSATQDNVVAFIDARRGNAWVKIKKDGINVLEEQFIEFNEIISKYSLKEYTYVTTFENCLIDDYKIIKPDYGKIITNAINKKATPPHLIDVNYLKKTEAEENYDNKK